MPSQCRRCSAEIESPQVGLCDACSAERVHASMQLRLCVITGVMTPAWIYKALGKHDVECLAESFRRPQGSNYGSRGGTYRLGRLQRRILDALAKRSMSVGELQDDLCENPWQVSSSVESLEGRGLVERSEDSSGLVRLTME